MNVAPQSRETDQHGLEKVQQLILSLERTLRSQRLYAANNPILVKHQTDLFHHFQQLFAETDELKLSVEPFRLLWGDEPVYRNQDQQDSFSFRLFSDGIRSISFHVGLTQNETDEFLQALALSASASSQEADAVTLLWEKEFDHVSYAIADAIVEEPLSDDKSTDEKVEELIDANMTMYQATGADADEDIYEDMKITINDRSVGKLFQDHVVLSREETQKIQADLYESDQPERLVLDFVDMVLAVLQEEEDPEEFVRSVQALGMILDSNLMQGQMGIARMAMQQVHLFPSLPIRMVKSDPQVLSKILKILWPVERITTFITALNLDPKGTPEDIETLVQLMDPGTIPHLLKQIVLVTDLNRRRLVCNGISKLHKGDLGVFIPMLSSKDPDVVKSAIYILSALRHEKVVDLVPTLLQHPNPAIRKEAVGILKHSRTSKGTKILLGLLNEPNLEMRILALRVLASTEDKEVARQLLAVINRTDFQSKTLEEKKGYFNAVARTAKDDCIPFLQNILGTRGWFQRPEMEEQYQCATYALTVIGSPLARETLVRLAKSGNKNVRRLSETALRVMGEPQK